MTRQPVRIPIDISTHQMSQLDDLLGNGQPATDGELSFFLWLDEQLGDLERRWSHFCTHHSIAERID